MTYLRRICEKEGDYLKQRQELKVQLLKRASRAQVSSRGPKASKAS